MLIVGLTGGIASGKSTVSKELKEKHKINVIDADLVAREVVYPGKRAYRQILETFGEEVENLVNKDGTLNRAALGKYVFGVPKNLAKLNGIVHPAVRKEILWRIVKGYIFLNDLVILDVPLLFESGLNKICGLTVTVTCNADLQLQRLIARNPELSREDALKRISSQMSCDEKNYRADLVIDNNGDLNSLRESVASIVKEVRPSVTLTLLDLIPIFGLASALYTIMLRILRDKYKGTKPPSKDE